MAAEPRPTADSNPALRGWRAVWPGVNRWRRKYWLGRALVVVALCAPMIGPWLARRDPVEQQTRWAVHSIRMYHQPPHAWNMARYHRAREAERLQWSLRAALARDDAAPETVGLDPAQLSTPAARADLSQLAAAARELGLVPDDYSAPKVRRFCSDAAREESRRFFDEDNRRIESILQDSYEWPDYGQWATWRRGLILFWRQVASPLGPLDNMLVWAAICLVIPATVSLAFRGNRPLVAMLAGLALALVPALTVQRWTSRIIPSAAGWLALPGYLLLCGAVACGSGKVVAGVTDRLRAALKGVLLLGLLLMASALLNGLGGLWLFLPVVVGGWWVLGVGSGLVAIAAVALFALRNRPRPAVPQATEGTPEPPAATVETEAYPGGWRTVWRAINGWRKRGRLVRLVILLAIFVPTIAPWAAGRAPITRLVAIAIDAIQKAGEPPHAWHLARYYRAEEAERLRMGLVHELDADDDGALTEAELAPARDAGLEPGQLDRHILRADLAQLVTASQELGLLPPSWTTRQIRRLSRDAAATASRRFFERAHHDIEGMLAQSYDLPSPGAYAEWETWERGLISFGWGLARVVGPLPMVVGWLAACFLLPGAVSLALGRRRRLAGAAMGAIILGVPAALLSGGASVGLRLLHVAAWTVLGAVLGSSGGRAANAVTHRLAGGCWAMLIAGAVLAGCGAVRLYTIVRFYRAYGVDVWYVVKSEVGLQAFGQPVGFIVVGGLLLAAGAFGLWLHQWAYGRLDPLAPADDCVASG